jgi:hypothetical protein
MSSYDRVMQDVEQRANSLMQKSAGRLSEQEAIRTVFAEDGALYERYRRASAHQPMPDSPPSRPLPQPSGAAAEALQKANALVQKDAHLTQTEALSRVFRDHPELYQRYRQGDDTPPAPPAPVVKVTPPPMPTPAPAPLISESLQRDILKTASVLSPGNRQKGLAAIEAALSELRDLAPLLNA